MVIVGSIGYDDIQTPAGNGSDLLGGAAVYSGLAASFHLRTHDEQPTKVGLVGVVGDDFAVYDQMILEKVGKRNKLRETGILVFGVVLTLKFP